MGTQHKVLAMDDTKSHNVQDKQAKSSNTNWPGKSLNINGRMGEYIAKTRRFADKHGISTWTECRADMQGTPFTCFLSHTFAGPFLSLLPAAPQRGQKACWSTSAVVVCAVSGNVSAAIAMRNLTRTATCWPNVPTAAICGRTAIPCVHLRHS